MVSGTVTKYLQCKQCEDHYILKRSFKFKKTKGLELDGFVGGDYNSLTYECMLEFCDWKKSLEDASRENLEERSKKHKCRECLPDYQFNEDGEYCRLRNSSYKPPNCLEFNADILTEYSGESGDRKHYLCTKCENDYFMKRVGVQGDGDNKKLHFECHKYVNSKDED